jgi:uncharacterized protein YbjT (DUF2867 family)
MKALILGATGLVGNELLELLEEDARFEKIELVSRRELELKDMKIINHIVDFEHLNELPIANDIDVLFIAFGTTIKTAGSKEMQWKIDVDIPTRIMKLAHQKGVKHCVLISALGVSDKSPFFYSRMKAAMDKHARQVGFEKLIIIKPSVLDGFRKEERVGERISIAIGNVLGKTGLIEKYKPVPVVNVAKCMIQSYLEFPKGTHEVHSGQIHLIAKRFKPEIGPR